MSRSRDTLLIDWLIDWLKKDLRVYLERAHPAFLTTLVVLVEGCCKSWETKSCKTGCDHLWWEK